MHSSAVALRSPAVMSMSISRPGRVSLTSEARRSSSSVSLPMALITTTTSLPRRLVRATWSATARMRSGSATEVPPNFWTTRATGEEATVRHRAPGTRASDWRRQVACAVMANQKSQRERERRAARDAGRTAGRREGRPAPSQAIAIAACGVVLLAVAGTVIAATKTNNEPTTAKATTTDLRPARGPVGHDPTIPGPTVSTPAAAAGATISGATPCPAEDGSSPRTTQFAQAPPTCSRAPPRSPTTR